MISILYLLLALVTSYVIGSFPTSFILTKFIKGVDIRNAGSKNAGATNVLRVVGKIPALATLVIDILKGLLVVTIVANFFYQFEEYLILDFYRPLMGLAAICGHIWPPFLRFKGGKGVATTIGVAIGIAPVVLMPVLGIWVLVFSVTKYVSLASIVSLLAFPIISVLFRCNSYTIILSAAICSIVIYKHKSNIVRLIKGEESKTIIRRKDGGK